MVVVMVEESIFGNMWSGGFCVVIDFIDLFFCFVGFFEVVKLDEDIIMVC